MSTPTLRPIAVLLLLATAGCTSFNSARPAETLPAGETGRNKYEVWSGGKSQVLIALRVTADTLSGVPYWKPPACDSCRVSFPRSQVDSVLVKSFDSNKTLLLAIVVTPILFVMAAMRGMGDPNY